MQSIEAIYRKNFPRMVIALARYVGLRDLATAEDIVQEAFAEAARRWGEQAPENPEAWLYRVCRNIALKRLRERKMEGGFFMTDWSYTFDVDKIFQSHDDDQLRMLLACTHPNFSTRNQVIFALRYVAGFRIEQIANILGSPPDTITKTLLRMRETIVKENITFHSDLASATRVQAQVLHKIIYLMFSEGSKTSGGRTILNLELCEDALGLGLAIVNAPSLALPETHALLGLMLLNLSRFEARFDENGEPIELEFQDRSKWNADMIKVAVHHLTRAGIREAASAGTAGNDITNYHLEAAIAWLHTSAPTFAGTDWKTIALLYEKLAVINESPFVKMNQAIAQFYAGDVLTALHHLKKLGESAFMQQHYLLHMALGKIYLATNDSVTAKTHFEKALELSHHEVEKRYIRKMYLS